MDTPTWQKRKLGINMELTLQANSRRRYGVQVPGADGLEAFWNLLETGESAVKEGDPGSGLRADWRNLR